MQRAVARYFAERLLQLLVGFLTNVQPSFEVAGFAHQAAQHLEQAGVLSAQTKILARANKDFVSFRFNLTEQLCGCGSAALAKKRLAQAARGQQTGSAVLLDVGVLLNQLLHQLQCFAQLWLDSPRLAELNLHPAKVEQGNSQTLPRSA
jgi:hypothetical protein